MDGSSAPYVDCYCVSFLATHLGYTPYVSDGMSTSNSFIPRRGVDGIYSVRRRLACTMCEVLRTLFGL